MPKIKVKIAQTIGIVGSIACIAQFIHEPSFLTPDKVVIFLTFVFMIFEQATQMLKRLLPFVVVIIIYESFSSIADKLNKHVNYSLAPHMDRLLFGNLPEVYLQRWLWHGHTTWYDIVLYVPYLLFFVMPLGLAILIWKTRDKHYWSVVTTFMVLFFAAFLTFLVFPSAPPWMASQDHYIQPVVRISSYVWASMGIHNVPLLYNRIGDNPVAAIPSLHAACSTLFAMFIFKFYRRRWGFLALIYPLMTYVGVVYEGEHYAFDVIVGIIYAFVAYFATPYLISWFNRTFKRTPSKLAPAKLRSASSTRSA